MIVNNVDILEKYAAILVSKDIQNGEINNYNDWLDNSITPIETKEEKFKFSKITVMLFIEGNNEEEVLTKISDILLICKSGTLKFNDMNFLFDISLTDSTNKKIYQRAYELTLTFKSATKYKDEIINTFSNITTFNINCIGNTKTSAIVEITPNTVDLIDLTITGLSEDNIIIKNLKMNKTVVINGEDGTVTVDGVNKFNDTDFWEFPTLDPGINVITVSKNTANIKIKYKPRWQ